MLSMLLPEIAMSSVRPLDKAAHEDVPRLSAAGLRSLASPSRIVVNGVRKLWEEVQTRLATEGMSGQDLRETAKGFAECLELFLRSLTLITNRAIDLGDETEDIRAAAAAIEVEVRSLLKEVTNVYELATRPIESGTREKIDKAIAEDPGVWVSHDEMVAEFVNGSE